MFVAKTPITFAVTITCGEHTPILRDRLVGILFIAVVDTIGLIVGGAWMFKKKLMTYCGTKNIKNNYVYWVVA